MRVPSPLVVAHQWGWDELLYFAIPVGIGLWLIRLAERRARRRHLREEGESPKTEGGESPRKRNP